MLVAITCIQKTTVASVNTVQDVYNFIFYISVSAPRWALLTLGKEF